MTNETKILLAAESESEMDAVWEFMDTKGPHGRKSLLDFFHGAKFMQNLMTSRSPAADRPGA